MILRFFMMKKKTFSILQKRGRKQRLWRYLQALIWNLTATATLSVLSCSRHLVCLKTSSNQWRRNFRLHNCLYYPCSAKQQPPSSPFSKGELPAADTLAQMDDYPL